MAEWMRATLNEWDFFQTARSQRRQDRASNWMLPMMWWVDNDSLLQEGRQIAAQVKTQSERLNRKS